MANPAHVEVVKQGAEAIRKWREEHPEVQLDLHWADLSRSHLSGTHLGEAKLEDANLSQAHLRGADLTRAHLRWADLSGANLRGANLSSADLHGASLRGANLDEAILGQANLVGADLHWAILTRADLREADLGQADLTGARWGEACLARANLSLAHGAYHARGLETTQLGEGDARYFETCDRLWPERWLDWERLRVAGRLPLFGISYTALILIPIVFYGLAVYNQQIDQVHTWAEQITASPDSPLSPLASLLKRLDRRPVPSLSLVLLVSTVLLAAGSTLYTFFCPSRIKEFSRDQWCDQLGRSLLHYWALAWKHRYIRLTCAACYALGGAGALWVLGTKVGQTALFILQYSTFPWPWR
jgi:uncharacterized protein YjbI with pentapeptide repeats